MLKELFKNLIFRVLGDYTEEISLDDMNINSWNGVFVKENISLKASSIEKLFHYYGLNIWLSKGMIGKLFFQVPWTKIWKEPCHVVVENVHILCSLRNTYNHEGTKEIFIEDKLSQLKEIEENEKKMLQSSQENQTKTKLMKFLKIIVENLRLEVKNFHLRIEDPCVTLANKKYAFGLFFDSIILEPANSKFETHFVDPETRKKEQVSYSLTTFNGIGLYTDLQTNELWSERTDIKKMTGPEFSKFSCEYYKNKEEKSFIFKPTKIVLQKTSKLQEEVGGNEMPTKNWDFFIDQLHFVLEDQQFKIIYYLMAFYHWSNQKDSHFIYRPAYNIRPQNKENAMLWWDYAIKSVILKVKNRREEKDIQTIAKRRVARERYIELYQIKLVHDIEKLEISTKHKLFKQNILIHTTNGTEDAYITFEEMLSILQDYEREFSLDECLHYRQVAKNKLKDFEYMNQFIKNKLKENEKTKNATPGFFKKMLSKIGFQQKPTGIEVDSNVIENIEEFIRNNNIFEKIERDTYSPLKFHKKMSLHANSIKIKLKQKVMTLKKFSFFNSKINNFLLEYSRYESKKVISLKAANVNVLDELTINKRFINVLKFTDEDMMNGMNGTSTNSNNALELSFAYEKFSENPYDDRKRISFNVNSAPFELILNKDLLTRLNFMLKNPIANSSLEKDFEIHPELIEKKLKEKILKHLGKNSKIELFANLSQYSIVFPKNPNAQDSSYFILEGRTLCITTKEQGQDGNSAYVISNEEILLRMISRQNFAWTTSFDKVFQENDTRLLEVSGLNLMVLKTIQGDGTEIVIDFNLEGVIPDIRIKSNSLSALLFKTKNNLQVSEINQPIMANETQFKSFNRESDISNGLKEIKKSKPETKSRTSSFFEEGIIGGKRQSFLEPPEYPNHRKESSNLQDSYCKENDETEEFFEAFEDLEEMLEAEKVIADNIVKLETVRDMSSTAKVKAQNTFQIFTLKYVRWAIDIGIQSFSLEIGLEEDFNLATSALFFEQKDISIKANLAPQQTNVNLLYSSLQLDYRQKKSLEIEKCIEIRSLAHEQERNAIRFRKNDLGQSSCACDLNSLDLKMRPTQISKLIANRKSSNESQGVEKEPSQSKPLELEMNIKKFDIRLLEQGSNYLKLETLGLKFAKTQNGSLSTSIHDIKLLTKNSAQKVSYTLLKARKKRPLEENMLSLEKNPKSNESDSDQREPDLELNLSHIKVIGEHRALNLALPILINYTTILKNLSSSDKEAQSDDEPTKSDSKIQIKIKKLALLLRPRIELPEGDDELKSSGIDHMLKELSYHNIQRKTRIKNQFKLCLEFSLTKDNKTEAAEMSYQLTVLSFHNNVVNRLVNNLEGNVIAALENNRKNTQVQIKALPLDLSSFDLDLIRRFLFDYRDLNLKFGKPSNSETLASKKIIISKTKEDPVVSIRSKISHCITVQLTALSFRIQAPSEDILNMINQGGQQKYDLRVEQQFVTIFEKVNFCYVIGGKEAQITSCSIGNISTYFKETSTSHKVWLLKKIIADQPNGNGAQNSQGFLKIKHISNKRLQFELESARFMMSKDAAPLIQIARDLSSRIRSTNKKEDENITSKKSISEPLEINLSIIDLSFCLYDRLSEGPVDNSNNIVASKNEANTGDSIVVLNFIVNTNTSIKYSPESLTINSEFIDISLSLTPKKTRHLNEKFRQEYIIFPTRLKFDFQYLADSYPAEIKYINVLFFEELCVDISSNHVRLINKIMRNLNTLSIKNSIQRKTKRERPAQVIHLDHLEITIPKSYLTLLIGKDVEVISKKNVYPIINASIFNIHIIGKKKELQKFQNFSSSFNLQLFYLNERNLYFEPLIENFNLKFDYESENNAKKFKLEVFDDLLINFTSASVDTMLKLSEEWSSLKLNTLSENSSNNLQNKTPVCVIKNETGCYLKCWINGDDVTTVEKQEEKQIHHKTVIEYAAYSLSRSRSADKQVKNIKSMNEGKNYYGKSNNFRNIFKFEENEKVLNIRIAGSNELIKLNLEQEGVFPWTLNANDKACSLLVDVSFSYEKGAKLVIIRSNVNLVNKLIRPVAVRLVEKTAKEEERNSQIITLNVGETLPVPIDCCNFNAIEIRPLLSVQPDFESEFKWSENRPVSIKEDEIKILFTCARNEEDLGNVVYVLMSKEKKTILPQVNQSHIKDSILPGVFDWAPAIHSLTLTHPVQIENLLPIPISLKFRMPVLALLSRFISKNIIYGDHMKNYKALVNSQINMYSSKDVTIPELGEGFAEDIHPFNGVLLSLSLPGFEKSEFHEVMDQTFQTTLRNYLKLSKRSADAGPLYTQGNFNEEFVNQFSKPYIFNKIFQFFSESQNEQLNVCLETVFYKGNLKLTFFSQYWFLNEASFPISVRFTEGSYTYDPITLQSSNSRGEIDKSSKENPDNKESKIYWLPEEETKQIERKHKRSFDMHTEGLQSFQKSRIVEENLINASDLDNTFFSLKSSQLSKAYIDNLLRTKSKDLKLITTNLVDNTETLMDISMEEITDWSNQLLISNFLTTQPCLEMPEKTSEKEKSKEKDKGTQEQEKLTHSRLFELCLNVVQLPGKLNRTKLVLIAPKYIIVNSTKFDILVSQMQQNKYIFGKIPTQHALSFHWNFKDKPKNLFIKIDKKSYPWSPGFHIHNPTSFTFRMRSSDQQEMQIFSINVLDLKIVRHSSIYLILIKTVNEKPPYLFDNNTRYHLKVYQEGRTDYDIIKPNEKYPYAFDAISAHPNMNVSISIHGSTLKKKVFLLDTSNNAEADLGIIDLSQKERVTITKKNFDNLFLDFLTDGVTTVLKFHYGIRDASEEDIMTGTYLFEVKANRVGVSLIDHIFNNGIHKELVFMQYEKISLMFHNTGKTIEFKAKLSDLQIDNKLVGTSLPVLLMTKTEKGKSKTILNKVFKFVKSEIKEKMLRKEESAADTFFKFHIILGLSQDKMINQLRLFRVRLRPIELNIDGNLLEIFRKILIYFSQKILPSLSVSRPKLKDEDFSLDSIQGVLAEKKSINEEGVTIDKLLISDINLTLNFKNFHAFIKEVSHFYILSSRLLAIVFNNFGSFVLDFDEFLLKNTKIAFDSLVNQLISYYTTCLNKQIYWLIANADIIGNPSLFLNQLSTAFSEFIEEFSNQLSLNPLSLGYGILKSTQSLCQSVVTAFVDSGDKIIQNIQNDTERLHVGTPDQSFESDQTKLYQSLMQSQKKESVDSILGSVSNLIHAILLFPFSQPITPYVMSKRKKAIKKSNRPNLVPKRPLRYISNSGVLEAFDEIKSKIQEYVYNMGENQPFSLEELYESKDYIIFFHPKGIVLLEKNSQEIEDFLTYENAELVIREEDGQVSLIIKNIIKEGKYEASTNGEQEIVLLQKGERFNVDIKRVSELFKRDEANSEF